MELILLGHGGADGWEGADLGARPGHATSALDESGRRLGLPAASQ